MQAISFYKPKNAPSGPPSAEHMAEMNAFMQKQSAAGSYVAGGGFLAGENLCRVTLSDGDYTVDPGLAKAAIAAGYGGFGITRAPTKEALIELTKEFLKVAGDGECEMHFMMDGPPPS